mgnify:CR=1 FL=1
MIRPNAGKPLSVARLAASVQYQGICAVSGGFELAAVGLGFDRNAKVRAQFGFGHAARIIQIDGHDRTLIVENEPGRGFKRGMRRGNLATEILVRADPALAHIGTTR